MTVRSLSAVKLLKRDAKGGDVLKERDNIHFTAKEIDGYNKIFNYIACSRDVGKSTVAACDKIYLNFKKYGRPALLVNRHISDISDQYIQSIEDEINKFNEPKITISYKTSDVDEGIVPLFVEDKQIALIIALSVSIRRIKQLKLKNISCIIFDEFICNPKYGEKYLKNEVEKFKEVYTTFRRCYEGKGSLKCYFFGNPYTRYNPYFMDTGVNLSRIKPGTIIAGDNWIIQSYRITDELYAILKEKNPYYSRDDAFSRYALDGESVNDAGIRLGKMKNGFKLLSVCEIEGRRIGIFRNPTAEGDDVKYHCAPLKYDNFAGDVYVFDLNDLLNGGTVLFNPKDNINFVSFRLAIRRNRVTYEDIATYYDVAEIYNYI